jgi:predicted transcriptional regulator
MATRAQIFGILAAASGSMTRAQLEEQIGESYRKFQSQLDREVKAELIQDTGDHNYVLTDKGRDEALKLGEFKDLEDKAGEEPGLGDKAGEKPGLGDKETEESMGTTEFQQFMRLGKQTGVVPLSLIKLTAEHVWDGGNFRDMKWVAQAMIEMGIREDLRGRWFHAWRAKIHQPIPTDLSPEFLNTQDRKAEDKKDEKTGKRDYILSEDDLPVNVGEGSGDMDYKDAIDLAKIRAARRKDTGAAGSNISTVDDILKIVDRVTGGKSAGKSWVVKPGEGGYEVEEVEAGKPLIIPPESTRTSPSYLVDGDGKVQEIEAGRPLVIIKETPKVAAGVSSSYHLIDKATGQVTEVAPGQPVIIMRESAPASTSQLTPIQVNDKDGKPMVLDLSTFIKLEEHRDKQRRDEETHETRIEIAKTFKDLLSKAGKALSHMGEEEGK